jgi:hypothetical protein
LNLSFGLLRFVIPGNEGPYLGLISLHLDRDWLHGNTIGGRQPFPNGFKRLLKLLE